MRASIQVFRWRTRTLKTSYGKFIQTMTTVAMASATSYTDTISMQTGRSSRRTGPTLIRLLGTPGDLQSASLMTPLPLGRSTLSKSLVSRLRRYCRADGPRLMGNWTYGPHKRSLSFATVEIYPGRHVYNVCN